MINAESHQGECVEDRKKHATCLNREQLLGDMLLNCSSFSHMCISIALVWVLLREVGLHGKGALIASFGEQLGKNVKLRMPPPTQQTCCPPTSCNNILHCQIPSSTLVCMCRLCRWFWLHMWHTFRLFMQTKRKSEIWNSRLSLSHHP